MNAPLRGTTILVTRPAERADGLAGHIRALGGEAIVFPTIEIQPLAVTFDPAGCDLAIFISPGAVTHGLPPVWPADLATAAVGQGTAAALRAAGVVDVLVPADGTDSEHLLALPPLAEMAGKRVTIFRGEGGRELLAQTLRARGARVDYIECYRRALPVCDPARDLAPVLERWRHGGIQAVTVLSSEGLDNLFTLLGDAALIRATPLFAPHPRIAEHARARGVATAIATAAGEAGLLGGLVEYFAHG